MQEIIIDDCWNSIGVWGDQQPRCPKLETLIHCNNCPVYSEAGRTLLNREAEQEYLDEWTRNLNTPRSETGKQLHSVLVFRLGDEWFALPSRVIKEITYCDKHHSLPHRKNPVLRGLVNVRGELLLCFSLGYLFKLQKSEKTAAVSKTIHARYIVISDEQEDYTFPVSEVNNILRYDPDLMEKAPSTISDAASSFVRGIIKHNTLNIGILDSDLVFTALHRNI